MSCMMGTWVVFFPIVFGRVAAPNMGGFSFQVCGMRSWEGKGDCQSESWKAVFYRDSFSDQMSATLITIHPLEYPEFVPNAAEQAVAEAVMKLGDGYVIRWGFYYSDESGTMQGEGDFLVLGPDGNVLHIEVKGGRCEFDPRTGRWDTADGRSPLIQRDKIWEQVLGMLKRQAAVGRLTEPLVLRMVALPDVEIPQSISIYQNMPRAGILDKSDLAEIDKWWGKHLHQVWKNTEERRAVFLEVFAPHLKQGVSKVVLSLTERQLERHTAARFEILDALAQNSQFLFRGGPGTGKTWFALEQAFRWATEGKRVLFLCYNLHLAEMLTDFVAGKKTIGIEVYSYESLAKRLYELAGEVVPEVNDQNRDEAKRFYEVEMPAKLRVIVELLGDEHRFDALVVDEAQDHDTRFHPDVGAPDGVPGWWELYAELLKQGRNAPVALFYDKFQRHHGRQVEQFDPERLLDFFPKMTRVRLKRTMRYTLQLLDFLRGIKHAEVDELLLDMDVSSLLPEGPEPMVAKAGSPGQEKSQVGKWVGDWCKKGECRPEDVLILYPTSSCRPDWLDGEKLVGLPLAGEDRGGGVKSSSVHKAKGLEAQAVILIGFPPMEEILSEIAPKGAAFTWFMGASRARQLLGIIERTDVEVTNLRTM